MVVNITDTNGNVIGTLELPDNTDSASVQAQLALYQYSVPAPSPQQMVTSSIQSAMGFGESLLMQYATQNVLAGITQANQTANVANYLQTLSYYLSSGSLYAAVNEINTLIADTSQTKQNLSPFVTNTILYAYLNQIQSYLGIALTQASS